MRRVTLDPPRSVAHPGVPHIHLAAPQEASPVPRAHFDPKFGWFRGIERRTSLALSRHVWGRVPGIRGIYGRILDAHLTVAEAEVPIAGLPRAFDGLAIVFISDVHAGPFLTPGPLVRAFDKLKTLNADVIVHGGDISTSNVREVLPHAAAIAGLRAPLGVFAVLGNHDHYTRDVPGIAALYERCGVRLLDNDAVMIERNGAKLAIAGIDDWNFGTPDLPRALAAAAVLAPGGPVVLMSHNPDSFFEAAARGVALVVSGHTHGGQVRIPGRPLLIRMSRYRLDEGRYESGAAQIIVSRGLGVSGIPLRLYCPPEVLRIVLRA